jgi:protein-L-isoaspartate(D-aspartate) O-methyltransferase
MLDELSHQGVGMTSQRTRLRLLQRLQQKGISHAGALNILAKTPRHLFVDEALAHRAYDEMALPIGFKQTLSQPYTVARMTELLLQNGHYFNRVLEIGTGSGYQTAILAQIYSEVYSVERIAPLHTKATRRLQALGFQNIFSRHADGQYGWPEAAPFDAILGTAAATELPPNLLNQLHPKGIAILPLGDDAQKLTLFRRHQDAWLSHIIESVHFVPLLSGLLP